MKRERTTKSIYRTAPLAALLVAGLVQSPLAATSGGGTAGTLNVPTPSEQQIQPCLEDTQGQPRVLVKVKKLQSTEGNLRVQIYGDDPDTFLEKGKKLVRVDIPIENEVMQVCVPLPGLGNYAILVMHDRNANGKADFLTEGFGFSNNPKLLLAPPDLEETLFAAQNGVVKMTVSLIYLIDVQQKEHRTRRRR